jgi:hypothetical protein
MIGAERLDEVEIAMMHARDRLEGERVTQRSERESVASQLREVIGDGPPVEC